MAKLDLQIRWFSPVLAVLLSASPLSAARPQVRQPPFVADLRKLYGTDQEQARERLEADTSKLSRRATAKEIKRVRLLGLEAHLKPSCFSDARCSYFDRLRSVRSACSTLVEMLTASTQVDAEMRPIVRKIAGADGGQLSGKLEDRLKGRASREEVLREALVEAQGAASPARASCLAATLEARLGAEIENRDAANLRDLTKVVAVSGWPTVDASSGPPWYFLIVQHADRQLAEQYRILLQWRPLLATNRVSPKAYAYLYDRVMLQLRGAQLYGTQFECQGGRYLPSRMEGADTVDIRRKELGMIPLGK